MTETLAIYDAARLAFSGYSQPSAIYRPKLFIDQNLWCALYGDNLQEGVSGFGDSPKNAMDAFNEAWETKLPKEAL